MTVFTVFAMIVLVLGVLSFYPAFIKRIAHPNIVIHNKMAFNKKIHPGDVFCTVQNHTLDCSSIPLWITSSELFDSFNTYSTYMMLQENGNLEFFAGSKVPFWTSNTRGRKCIHIHYLGKDEWKLECLVGGDVHFRKNLKKTVDVTEPTPKAVVKTELLQGDFIAVGERLCSKDNSACVELKDDGTFQDVYNPERIRTNGRLKADFLSKYHRYTCTMDNGFILQIVHVNYDPYNTSVIFSAPCEKILLTKNYDLQMYSNGHMINYPLFS
jgi:hypothetical protein